MAKKVAAESTPVAESGSARRQGIFADICEEMHRLARHMAALRRCLAEVAPRTDLKRMIVAAYVDRGFKAKVQI